MQDCAGQPGRAGSALDWRGRRPLFLLCVQLAALPKRERDRFFSYRFDDWVKERLPDLHWTCDRRQQGCKTEKAKIRLAKILKQKNRDMAHGIINKIRSLWKARRAVRRKNPTPGDEAIAHGCECMSYLPRRTGGHPDLAYFMGLGTGRRAHCMWADEHGSEIEKQVEAEMTKLREQGALQAGKEGTARTPIQNKLRSKAFKEQPADVRKEYERRAKQSKTILPKTDMER